MALHAPHLAEVPSSRGRGGALPCPTALGIRAFSSPGNLEIASPKVLVISVKKKQLPYRLVASSCVLPSLTVFSLNGHQCA